MSVTFADLGPGACRYPPWTGECTGLFCGAPATDGPYCTEHHGICTEPVTPDALNYLRFIGTVGGRWRGSSRVDFGGNHAEY